MMNNSLQLTTSVLFFSFSVSVIVSLQPLYAHTPSVFSSRLKRKSKSVSCLSFFFKGKGYVDPDSSICDKYKPKIRGPLDKYI
jgi:hypothetical protein